MRRSSLAAVAAFAGAALVGAGAVATQGPGLSAGGGYQITKQANKTGGDKRQNLRAILGGGIGEAYTNHRRAAYGWTNMHQRRVARKKRNQARHRAAGRGKR